LDCGLWIVDFGFAILGRELLDADLELALGLGAEALGFGLPTFDQVGPADLAGFLAVEVARMMFYLCVA
jgi:hypothetical protein